MKNKKRHSNLYRKLILAGGATLFFALPVQATENPPATSVQGNQIVAWAKGHSIWTMPYGVSGASYVGSTNDYVGKEIQLVQKMTVNKVTWYQFSMDGKVIGWLDSRALSGLQNIQLINQNSVMGATIANGIWSMPYGVPGANYLGSTDFYAYRDIHLIESATYGGVQWYKFSVDGKVIGWMDKKALNNAAEVKSTNFPITIGRTSNNGIWSTPYGVTGAQYLGGTNDYAYQTLQVVKTVKRGNVNWYQVTKGDNLLGWIDGEKAVTDLKNMKNENYSIAMGSSSKGDGIWSAPYGEYGANWVDSINSYTYQNVQVVQSATKENTTWKKIKVGNRVLGWVDEHCLTDSISNIQNENKIVLIGDTGHGVWSKPYGENGASYVGSANNYDNRPIQVTRSLNKDGVRWYYFKVDGQEKGWIDARAISDVTNIQPLNKVGHVSNTSGHALWSKPYGMQNAKYVGSASDFANQNLKFLNSVTYNGVTWYQVEQSGRIGWIDNRAVSEGAITKRLIFIDPGHQVRGDLSQERVSPSSDETKYKVTYGTQGVATKKSEYQLTLETSFILKEELEKRGFAVMMSRTTHDVNISNIQRAEMANNANAALTVRVHADGSEDSDTVRGFSVLTPDNTQDTHNIYQDSLRASQTILNTAKANGINIHGSGVYKRSDLTGFNWSKTPVTLLEMGFMSNPDEDRQLSDRNYQRRLMSLVADGIAQYFK
ncbi:GW domain-containing glycosaminoglycan-binding protein [Bacillus cytotoxicus]|uniref:GW domain-containing glycosaminoglycan-binding protein n=1 Tax=Bacillus cytotoxicus TaxID=580165 RepID=A0ACC6AAD1_9BACI|nr:GW domain-containing glycosaminoglycan-binding protein [Bacillus cytotoxicus]